MTPTQLAAATSSARVAPDAAAGEGGRGGDGGEGNDDETGEGGGEELSGMMRDQVSWGGGRG